jgi:RNA polymerase sigma-70 factor (ECF subfamily)
MSVRGKARLERAPISDAEILQRIANGDLGALGALYDRYHAPLRQFVARAVRDDVDDLVHITFLEAAKSAARYDGRPARPWLIGIALKHLARRRTALARLMRVVSSLHAPEPAVAPPDERADLERALAKIAEPKRIAFLLAELEGMSGPEIAALTGVPVGTVWTRLHAARRELRALLEVP